ncbi:putative sulfate exporter family transporter, partial [Pediococcus acidilactici]|nr:putative sulfate exporter family transporter [Pediococcus acidilactici]
MAKLVKEKSFWTAIGVTLLCALAGSLLAQLPYFSLIGALVISLVLGMLVQFSPRVVEKSKKGTGFISNKFLRLGIILLGFKLNLIDLAHAGVKTILLAVLIVGLTILVVYNLARKFNVESNLAMLVASGTGICGAAAVMGISPQIQVPADQEEQKREDEVMAIAVVAILGTVFTFIEIGLKSWLHLTPTQFGVVAGGSLHEIAHAVATGGAGGPVSLD